MADMAPPSANWTQAWVDSQRQMWDAWSATVQQMTMQPGMHAFPSMASMQGPVSPMQFWSQAVERWMAMASPQAPVAPEQRLMRQAFSVGEGFLRMGEEVFRAFQEMQKGAGAGQEWTTALNRAMQQAKEYLTASQGAMGGNAAFNAFLGAPMESWQRLLSQANPWPAELLKMSQGGGQHPLMDMFSQNFSQLMSTPALGYTRERQEHSQKGMVDLVEYQESSREYMAIMGRVSVDALDLFHRKLLERGANDRPFSTLKEVYDLWVECGEEVHAKVALSEEYSRSTARMVNATSRLRRHGQSMVEDVLNTMNMPTRSELNTLHRQVLELKRRMVSLEETAKSLKKRDLSHDLSALRDDMERLPINDLRSELESLKKQIEEPEAKSGSEDGTGEGVSESESEIKIARAAPRRPARSPRTGTPPQGE